MTSKGTLFLTSDIFKVEYNQQLSIWKQGHTQYLMHPNAKRRLYSHVGRYFLISCALYIAGVSSAPVACHSNLRNVAATGQAKPKLGYCKPWQYTTEHTANLSGKLWNYNKDVAFLHKALICLQDNYLRLHKFTKCEGKLAKYQLTCNKITYQETW